MWRLQNLSLSSLLLVAQQPDAPAEAQRQLDPIKRFQLIVALVLVLILGAVAILVIRVTGRLVRWYARDSRAYRPADRATPDIDDWAQKPLLPPLDDFDAEPPRE